MSSIDIDDHLQVLLASGTAREVKDYIERHEAMLAISPQRFPDGGYCREVGRGEDIMCEERGVPVNYLPADEVAWNVERHYGTPARRRLPCTCSRCHGEKTARPLIWTSE